MTYPGEVDCKAAVAEEGIVQGDMVILSPSSQLFCLFTLVWSGK